MKHAIYALLALTALCFLIGCQSYPGHRQQSCMGGSCAPAPENYASCSCEADNCQDPGQEAPCRLCGGLGCRLCRRAAPEAEGYAAGPATGTITYPYYTVRGPRDYLARNPQSIGP